MKIFVLGYKGMLGRYVYDYLRDNGYEVIGLTRYDIDASIPDLPLHSIFFRLNAKEGDAIINCIGAIKPQVDKLGTFNAIKVNSIFPHVLAEFCEERGYKLIHITTDCVFSGNEGEYTEESLHDCTDVYGKTKSLGEPSNCTVVRTSIIGEEFGTSRSLIEWVKSQDGKTVNGYLNHQWNGLTCLQVAKVFCNIIENNKYWMGVRHIYSPDSLNKYELVKSIASAHELNIEVLPVDGPSKCDRTLSTSYVGLNNSDTFNIPHIMSQLEEQFYNPPKIRNNLT